jgi:hypothetical protein
MSGGRLASHWLENLGELPGRTSQHPNVYIEDVEQGLADYAYAEGIAVRLPSGGTVRCKYRAPAVDFRRPYVCCVGSAHTFGRWSRRPYPALLQESLDLPVVNLGYGGAGPEFFLGIEEYREIVHNARLVVLQVMSGRSSSCSLWRVLWGRWGQRVADGRYMVVKQFIAGIRGDVDLERRFLDETLATYTNEMTRLLRIVDAPAILFWFSDREPGERQRRLDPKLWHFPHLVGEDTVAAISAHATTYVECVLRNRGNDAIGLGAKLGARYYPSQEMHDEGARRLTEAIRAQRLS